MSELTILGWAFVALLQLACLALAVLIVGLVVSTVVSVVRDAYSVVTIRIRNRFN